MRTEIVLDNPDVCNNLSRTITCKSLKRLFTYQKKKERTAPIKDITHVLIAYGFCRKAYLHIIENFTNYDLDMFELKAYIEEHPLFKDYDEIKKFMDDFEKLIDFKISKSFEKRMLMALEMPAEWKVTVVVEGIIWSKFQYDNRFRVLQRYHYAKLTIQDICKYFLAKRPDKWNIYRSITPITEADGFNIDVEGLL